MNVCELPDVLQAIRAAIDATGVDDDSTAATTFLRQDRVDSNEHMGVYVFCPRSRATDTQSQADGLDFIRDTIQIRFKYQLRNVYGQEPAYDQAIRHAKALRLIVTAAKKVARVRWVQDDRVFEGQQKGWLTITQTYQTEQRTDAVKGL